MTLLLLITTLQKTANYKDEPMKYFLTLALFASFSAFARNFSDAGCGLGTMLLQKNDNQIIVATLNGTGSQTFAISSGTSNCGSATSRFVKIKNFIETNYESVVTDMAKGNGDSLQALASFYGCDSAKFGKAVQADFASIASSKSDATRMMININNTITDNKTLHSSCYHVL